MINPPGKVTFLYPDGHTEVRELQEHGNYDYMRDVIYPIEVVPHWNTFDGEPAVVFCHEEGKLIGLPYNPLATLMWAQALGKSVKDLVKRDYLVGPVAIVQGTPEFMAEI